jgi:hypothetical protein
MSKVQATALVMFTLQVKKSLELKRSKSDDSYEEWSICQSILRPAEDPFRPAGKHAEETEALPTPCGPQKTPYGPQQLLRNLAQKC